MADDLALLLTERFSATGGGAAPVQPTLRRPLPRPLTRLIGRDAEVAQVGELLSNPAMRLVTLVGPGGIGKTRLALAVAERVSGGYADGVAYVDLAPLSEPALVQSAIAEATGLRESTGRSLGMALRESLADAEMLIVLDNMEQLLDAARTERPPGGRAEAPAPHHEPEPPQSARRADVPTWLDAAITDLAKSQPSSAV